MSVGIYPNAVSEKAFGHSADNEGVKVRKYWFEVAAGLGLLAAMQSAVGSLPLADWRPPPVDSGVTMPPPRPLHLMLPSDLTNHAHAEPELEVEITSSAATDGLPSNLFGADHLDVAPDDLIATLRTGSMLARVGPQGLGYDSLIHKDRPSKGAMAALEVGGQTKLKGFGVQSKAMPGYRRLLGSDQGSHTFNGMVVEHRLAGQGDEGLNLVAGWLSGVAHAGGTDEAATQRAGNAWSVAADTALLEKRLRLQFEYARSRFDSSHVNDGTERVAAGLGRRPERNGQAYRFGTELHSSRSSAITWHLGTKFDQVTPWFGSLANPTLTDDWQRLQTYGVIRKGEWKLDLSLEQRQSNLERDSAIPTLRSEKGQIVAAWTPLQPVANLFAGKPSIRLTADYGRRNRIDAVDTPQAGQSEQRKINLMLQAEFAHSDGLWGVRAKGGKIPGAVDADARAGARTLALDLYGDFTATALKPMASWQSRRDEATGTTDDRWRAGLSLADVSLHAQLKAGVKLAYQRRVRSDVGSGDNGLSLDANLKWQLQRPAAGRSGLTLAVSGSYLGGDRGLVAPAGADDYRFMVSLSARNLLDLE